MDTRAQMWAKTSEESVAGIRILQKQLHMQYLIVFETP